MYCPSFIILIHIFHTIKFLISINHAHISINIFVLIQEVAGVMEAAKKVQERRLHLYGHHVVRRTIVGLHWQGHEGEAT